MLCYAMLCYAMLCYAMLCYAMLCYAIPCLCYAYAMLCYAMLCYAMLYISTMFGFRPKCVISFIDLLVVKIQILTLRIRNEVVL